ncbi:MAG: ABC transporter ATP-binding protein [candidate division WOR-3 bacterium]|nr:MAG: ABC transporter ATP-binding protein [candidate division WOR-3 bacterium]
MIQSNQLSEVVSLIDVTKAYGSYGRETLALKKVSFRAHLGELILILGPSGSGKTTLLTLLAGLQSPTEGTVYIFGREVKEYSNRELQRLRAVRIGFIFQTFNLIDSLTVLDNVMLVMKFGGLRGKEAFIRAMDFLDRFEVKQLSKASPRTLSQGEKQRVAVARALVNGAPLIIADEPTGSLATKQGMGIVGLLRRSVNEENRCVIIASHDERISDYADRVLYLSDGVIAAPEIHGNS